MIKKNSDTAITFYKTIQNKFHYAITGNTAAEIVYKRVDSKKRKYGTYYLGKFTWWEDFKIWCNYCQELLNEQEIKNLNNLINLFLDIAENNAERNITMYVEDWKNEVENTLKVFHQKEKEKSHINKQSKNRKTNMKNIKLYRIRIMCQILIDY